jgi:hypothetical protein
MKKSFFLLLLIIPVEAFTQSQVQIDSISMSVCATLNVGQERADTIRLAEVYRMHFAPFLRWYREDKLDSLASTIHIRLQRLCPAYEEIVHRLMPSRGDWQELTERPKMTLEKKTCKEFFKLTRFYYIEANDGSTVYVEINNGLYKETFSDGTYSKLEFSQTGSCVYEIEFIESNNKIRKGFSKRGDRYRYTLLDQEENYYLVMVEIPGSTRMLTFKMYVDEMTK